MRKQDRRGFLSSIGKHPQPGSCTLTRSDSRKLLCTRAAAPEGVAGVLTFPWRCCT